MPEAKVKELAEVLCTDSAKFWGHEVATMLHASGEALLDRLFYREMPTRTTSHSSTTKSTVTDVSDGAVGENSFQLAVAAPSNVMAIKAECPAFDKMRERAKVLASGLKALEKQHSEASGMQAKFEAFSVKDANMKKPAKDLKDCLKTLDGVVTDIRSKLAVAECIEKDDELGKLPAEIDRFIQLAETHMDGIRGMRKRLSALVSSHSR